MITCCLYSGVKEMDKEVEDKKAGDFNIDNYKQKETTVENATYNATLIYYRHTVDEILELQKALKKYERIIKKLSTED